MHYARALLLLDCITVASYLSVINSVILVCHSV